MQSVPLAVVNKGISPHKIVYQKICMVNIPTKRAAIELEEILQELDCCTLLISDAHYRYYLVINYNYLVIKSTFF